LPDKAKQNLLAFCPGDWRLLALKPIQAAWVLRALAEQSLSILADCLSSRLKSSSFT
jgi:hypothetical protein